MARLEKGSLKQKVKVFTHLLITFLKKNYDNEKHPFLIHIYMQLFRSGSSVRANLAEADVAISNKEFRRILGICLREASETKERLDILSEECNTPIPQDLLIENVEIIKILKTIIGKMS